MIRVNFEEPSKKLSSMRQMLGGGWVFLFFLKKSFLYKVSTQMCEIFFDSASQLTSGETGKQPISVAERGG